MASGPITPWQIDGEAMETVSDFIFRGSKITADGDHIHETKRHLLLGRKVMTKRARPPRGPSPAGRPGSPPGATVQPSPLILSSRAGRRVPFRYHVYVAFPLLSSVTPSKTTPYLKFSVKSD